ncbi:hypothetical protein V2S66_03435 [Streptomyces sp. V4-01]|uniref:Uncharacterized protein n=1 Tax=Actinacidiphila polyblastidii TaxID=3110430 RepID=A0ABU7P5E0_9ACTN|nr:hypothetical protein [Streptomyces sp. V4-01]
MTDTDIPQPLLDAQRAFDTAHATLMGAPADLPVEERQALRQVERDAAFALQDVRAGTPWATVAGQKLLREAARA